MTVKQHTTNIRIPEARLLYNDLLSHRVFSPSRRVVLLVHGTNGTMNTWNDVAPLLAEHTDLPVLVFDLPHHGHNCTFVPTTTRSADDVLADLEKELDPYFFARKAKDLLDATFPCAQQVHVFGHSHGGRTALAFAELYPAVIASVSLGDIGVSPCPRPARTKETLQRSAKALLEFRPDPQAQHDAFPSFDAAAAHLEEAFSTGARMSLKIERNPATGLYESLIRPHVGLLYDYAWRQTDFRDTWADLEAPILSLRASQEASNFTDDEWALMKELRFSTGKRDRSRFVVVHDADHGIHRTHPNDWITHVAAFIKDTDQAHHQQ